MIEDAEKRADDQPVAVSDPALDNAAKGPKLPSAPPAGIAALVGKHTTAKAAVEAGVGSVMCSYNRVRRVWSCENPQTLQRDLKERLGFEGWVMSDWGATHSTSINAGLDQEMPGPG